MRLSIVEKGKCFRDLIAMVKLYDQNQLRESSVYCLLWYVGHYPAKSRKN